MAPEEIAAILNDMAPDDRTMLLEELSATVTIQMLAWLTPEERAVAVSLLGYPEESIGRLMTPDYIAAQQGWSVQEVLDYIREHGHESETLSIIYVIDAHGILIDEIRIRKVLLAPLTNLVSDLMDRPVFVRVPTEKAPGLTLIQCYLQGTSAVQTQNWRFSRTKPGRMRHSFRRKYAAPITPACRLWWRSFYQRRKCPLTEHVLASPGPSLADTLRSPTYPG